VARRLIVLGDCNPDLVLTGNAKPVFGQVETLVDDATLTIGGSGAITAAGAARLGVDSALIATVGDDDLGRLQLAALADAGVDTSRIVVDPQLPTGMSLILGDGEDRAILTAAGAITALAADQVGAAPLATADHVHVSSLFLLSNLRPGLPELLRAARAGGATTSVDTNWDPAGSWSDGIEEVLDEADVLLPNLEEARRLSGETDGEAALWALAERVPTVVIKLGADGAIAVERGRSEVVRAPSWSVEMLDTTGAGDSFNAGFIAARLEGAPLADALAQAVACGALATRGLGGTTTQPTLAESRALIAGG
jgi:sugar/nucleoside kinase (ribokinase family)